MKAQSLVAFTPTLEIAYEERGPTSGSPVVLLHGFPYDIRQYDAVCDELADSGQRVLVPYLRGFGPTRYRNEHTDRCGQQAALGKDIVDFLDALHIPIASLVGYDWGGRAACVAAAIWPERVKGLVSCSGYTIHDIAKSSTQPPPPGEVYARWYVNYFNTTMGLIGLEQGRSDFCKFLWKLWSPTWRFSEEEYRQTAISFENQDFVATVIQEYRHRLGNAPGDPRLADIERDLAARPAIAANGRSFGSSRRSRASPDDGPAQDPLHRPVRKKDFAWDRPLCSGRSTAGGCGGYSPFAVFLGSRRMVIPSTCRKESSFIRSAAIPPETTAKSRDSRAQRTLALASLNHALHDGFTDMIYVLLPVWQAEFALDYVALAVLRALYVGVLAALQVPAARLAKRINARTILVLGTLLSSAGYALAGFSGGLVGLCASLVFAGAGGSTQHPLSAAAVTRAYREKARGPLGIYNFAGDLGKATLPPLISVLLTVMHWRSALDIAAGLGMLVAFLIRCLMPTVPAPLVVADNGNGADGTAPPKGGFGLLLIIGLLDTAARMGFLLFLPFLLRAKGASLTTVGFALSLVFIGGAFGKAACGWLGARLGLQATVVTTEVGTAATILSVLAVPLIPSIVILPFLGVMLNGTSSVLYGTVPELVAPKRIERAFALFYTGILGSSALAPVLYGRLGDAEGSTSATVAAAITAVAVVPLMLLLSPRLDRPSLR